MSKYDYELKLKIIRENNEGYGYGHLSEEYNISKNTIRNWCQQYGIFREKGIEKSMSKTKYSGEFKLTVLKYRQNHKISYRETAEHFGIKNASIIANWQRSYLEDGFEGLNGSVGRPKKNGDSTMPNNKDKPKQLSKSEREELIELRERNEYLEAELQYLKKLDALLQKKKSQTKKRRK